MNMAAKKTIWSRINNIREILLLIFALATVYMWFESRIVKAEILSMENNVTLLLLPYSGNVNGAPPEVVATFNIWIKELARKREG